MKHGTAGRRDVVLHYFENAFVNLVNLCIDMRTVSFWRSTSDVEMCCGFGPPAMIFDSHPRHTGGL